MPETAVPETALPETALPENAGHGTGMRRAITASAPTSRSSGRRPLHLVAVLALGIIGGGLLTASAAPGPTASSFVPIAPCRLFDTRPAPDNVGSRSAPLGAGDIYDTPVRGTNGNCTIPSTAVGVSMNVAIVNPTAASFLTVYPSDAPRPLAASLNWVAGQDPTPNAVTAALSTSGQVSFYNLAGTVDLAVDVVGYYLPVVPPTAPLNRLTDQQIALGRWDQDPGRPATFTTGLGPAGLAFDGSSLWVTNYEVDTISRVDRVTGTHVEFATGDGPNDAVWDGRYVWTANYDADTLSRVDPRDGSHIDVAVGDGPLHLAFDGANVWVSNLHGDSVSRVAVATNTVSTFPALDGPSSLVFDGTAIWFTNRNSDQLSRMDVTTGARTDRATGDGPEGVIYDGRFIWVANRIDASMQAFDPSTGALIRTVALVTPSPVMLTYDGRHVWVTHDTLDVVCEFDPQAGVELACTPVGDDPYDILFDGRNIWVANYAGGLSSTVTKLLP